MSHPSKQPLITIATILASASLARADLIVHELGSTAANTLSQLSRNIMMGCAILAVAIVAAAFITKKK
jgi:hypothetical protein